MIGSTLQKLSLICLISSTVPAACALSAALGAADTLGLFSRQASVCGGDASLKQCGTGFPSSFCCPTSTTCLSLNNTAAASVICCPAGNDCKQIKPIQCDIQQQNATAVPAGQLHTENLSGKLPTCGDACCPFGYNCQNGNCVMASATSATTTSTTPSSATSTGSVGSGPTSQASPTQTLEAPVDASGAPLSGRAFVAGFFPGIVLGIIGTLLAIFCIKKRKEKKEASRYSGDFGHVSRSVSDPIYNPEMSARTDFLRNGAGLNNSPGRPQLARAFSFQHTPTPYTGNARAPLSRAGSATTVDQASTMHEMTPGRWVPPEERDGASPGSTNSPYSNNKGIAGTMAADAPKTPRIKSIFSRSPRLAQHQAKAYPKLFPERDYYGTAGAATPTPERQATQKSAMSKKSSRKRMTRNDSTETIDVLMPGANFAGTGPSQRQPERAMPAMLVPGHREERPLTGQTTFTSLMADAGFSPDTRRTVSTKPAQSGMMGSPGYARI